MLQSSPAIAGRILHPDVLLSTGGARQPAGESQRRCAATRQPGHNLDQRDRDHVLRIRGRRRRRRVLLSARQSLLPDRVRRGKGVHRRGRGRRLGAHRLPFPRLVAGQRGARNAAGMSLHRNRQYRSKLAFLHLGSERVRDPQDQPLLAIRRVRFSHPATCRRRVRTEHDSGHSLLLGGNGRDRAAPPLCRRSDRSRAHARCRLARRGRCFLRAAVGVRSAAYASKSTKLLASAPGRR